MAYHPFFIENSLHFHAYTKIRNAKPFLHFTPAVIFLFHSVFACAAPACIKEALLFIFDKTPLSPLSFASLIIEGLAGTLSTSLFIYVFSAFHRCHLIHALQSPLCDLLLFNKYAGAIFPSAAAITLPTLPADLAGHNSGLSVNKHIAKPLSMAEQGHSFDPFEFYCGEIDGGNAQELARLTDSTFSTLFQRTKKQENLSG